MSQRVDIERVKDILAQALEQPEGEKLAFVRRLCDGDSALLREVQSLLEQDTGPTPSLTEPFFELLTAPDLKTGLNLEEGRRIGPYQVVRQIGQGGMGIVVLATRADDFEKQVAIKVIQPGLVNDEVLQRFHNERQILAHLDHPSIARILDGGTTEEGLPYFVMEYVEGTRIDHYCRQNRLSLRERLELFHQLCSALQVAHRNLVVHRDLKPSNILVTAGGTPKLLDFGIAKRLNPETDDQITRLAQSPMTLKYASPEQIHPTRPISVASDIYSVGVLLFEALTDQYPYDVPSSESSFELAQAICDDPPQLPSQAIQIEAATLSDVDPKSGTPLFERQRLKRMLSGDLDSIVLKSLAKDPEDRYGSIEQLADDLTRYLDGHPVSAREGTLLYRMGKFLRRNTAALVAAALLLASAMSVGVLWLENREARQEEEFAQEQADLQSKFFIRLFKELNPDSSAKTEIRIEDFLRAGVGNAKETFGDYPHVKGEMLSIFGILYGDFGLLDEAEQTLEEAYETLLSTHPQPDDLSVARAYGNLAVAYYSQGRFREALEIHRLVLETRVRAGKEGHELAPAKGNIAAVLSALGHYQEAESIYQEIYQIRLQEYKDPEHSYVVATQRNLANHYLLTGKLDTAETLVLEALDVLRSSGKAKSSEAAALSTLGRIQRERGQLEEARLTFKRNLDLRRQLYRGLEKHNHIIVTKIDLASVLISHDPTMASRLLEEALEALQSKGIEGGWIAAEAGSWKGYLLTFAERFEEAEEILLKSYQTLTRLRGENSLYSRHCIKHLIFLYEKIGRDQEAERYRKILEENQQRSLAPHAPNPDANVADANVGSP